MAVTKISDKIQMISTTPLDSNIYIINNGALMIDSTTGYHKKSLAKDFRSLGLTFDSILSIINTHTHYDHIGGNPLFGNAKIMMHENSEKNLHSTAERVPYHQYFRSNIDGIKIHIPLKDNDTVRAKGTRLVILHTPGHTDDSICVYMPEDRILLTGDSVTTRIDKMVSYYIKNRKTESSCLGKLRALDIDILLPGHGDPVRDPQKIKELLNQ